ncbi:ribosomal RNA small subunit methyltransferase A [Patescibacteria group bacterium]|nr:MAG: ribosomal RNA small subunit methyltransferase A [Patescibacteria group bacterium]
MNRSVREETAALLAAHGLPLSKLRGQHLLVDAAHLARIVAAARLGRADAVLEIGPGTGVLTERLLATGARVTAVELDQRMAHLLAARFSGEPRFTLVVGDALREVPRLSLPAGYAVVANLPYQITTPLLWELVGPDRPAAALPTAVTVLVQKEVADRMLARPPRLNLLALLMQTYGAGERIAVVPPGAFLPPPKVTSASVRFVAAPVKGRDRLLSLARAGFSAPRRLLAGNLAAAGIADRAAVEAALTAAGLPEDVRAERLSLTDWQRVAAAL